MFNDIIAREANLVPGIQSLISYMFLISNHVVMLNSEDVISIDYNVNA